MTRAWWLLLVVAACASRQPAAKAAPEEPTVRADDEVLRCATAFADAQCACTDAACVKETDEMPCIAEAREPAAASEKGKHDLSRAHDCRAKHVLVEP